MQHVDVDNDSERYLADLCKWKRELLVHAGTILLCDFVNNGPLQTIISTEDGKISFKVKLHADGM